MGYVFDKRMAALYEAWTLSPQGRHVDRSLEHLIRRLLDPQPGERALDIGCGTGNHLLLLNRMGLDVSGVDASPAMIAKAKERLGHRCTLKTGWAEDLPFEDNSFDVALLINTLEYLDDPVAALREAGRVTQRKIFLGVFNGLSLTGLVNRMRGGLGDPFFSRTRFLNLWQVRAAVQSVYGPVPMTWSCLRMAGGGAVAGWSGPGGMRPFPFGFFLGVAVPLLYTVRTENLPLKVRLRSARPPAVSTPLLKHLPLGANHNERSLSL